MSAEEVASLLRGFRAKANDRGLRDLARRWESALPTSAEPAAFEIRWKRYRIQKGSYRKALNARLEPGQPDIYVRVFRTRDGSDERVFDSSGQAVEAWAFDWSEKPEYPTFTLDWAKGDFLRVELREKDVFGDNTIATYELGGELSILLLSTPRTGTKGHAIEFESSFGFGK